MDTIDRITAVKSKTGYKSNSSVYARVSDETLTPPVKLGPRSSGWPASEIDAIVRARIAGKSDDEIRHLVRELVAKRQEVAVGGEAA